jgi:hypothetical protein
MEVVVSGRHDRPGCEVVPWGIVRFAKVSSGFTVSRLA